MRLYTLESWRMRTNVPQSIAVLVPAPPVAGTALPGGFSEGCCKKHVLTLTPPRTKCDGMSWVRHPCMAFSPASIPQHLTTRNRLCALLCFSRPMGSREG